MREEVIYLSGGLIGFLQNDSVNIYPALQENGEAKIAVISQDDFKNYIATRKIEVIGIKETTLTQDGKHWRWAPANDCENPPHNNPSYRWQSISSSILRALERGERYPSLAVNTTASIAPENMAELSSCAGHIAISLHQLNFAMMTMTEFFQNELLGQLNKSDLQSMRYSHIRHFDLAAHVHSFFQAFSAARDHFAHFLAIQISRQRAGRAIIDDMSKLLKNVDPAELRNIPLIRALEQKNLLCEGTGSGNKRQEIRLRFCENTWLAYANTLRRRFTHHMPYGAATGEDTIEFYSAQDDQSLHLVKAFLDKEGGEFCPDLLRTTNGLYQNICALFIAAADLTGYKADPVTIEV